MLTWQNGGCLWVSGFDSHQQHHDDDDGDDDDDDAADTVHSTWISATEIMLVT